jgi:hypothetical protein
MMIMPMPRPPPPPGMPKPPPRDALASRSSSMLLLWRKSSQRIFLFLQNFSHRAGNDLVVDLSIQSRRLAGSFSKFSHFGIVPKSKNVCEPRIPGGDGAAEKKKNDI